MNMIEALQEAATSGRWARPIRWRSRRVAIIYEEGMWLAVPDSHGGTRPSLPLLDDVTGEWETVTPDEFYAGRAR